METGKIQNGTTMNNPLGTNSYSGLYSQISKKNRSEDLSRILDQRDSFTNLKGKNKAHLPTKALVINLIERTDRWEKFQNKNPDIFSKMSVERFDAIKGETKIQDAIFSSHMGCLEMYPDEECILVLEDDCELAEGWYEKLKNAFLDLPAEWDVLIGNHYAISYIGILSDHLAKPQGTASTANFIVYNKSALCKIKNEIHLRQDGLLDIDHFLTDPRTSIINYSVWPMLSREFVSVSDHYGKIRNMEYRVREHAFLFQYIDSEKYYPSIECW